MHLSLVASLMFLGAGLPATGQDMTIVYRLGGDDSIVTFTHQISDRGLRVSFPSTDLVIVDGQDEVLSINHEAKRYFVTPVADMSSPFGPVPPTGAESAKAETIVLSRGEERKVIAGHSAERYLVSLGAQSSLEVWMASDLPRPAHYLRSWTVLQLVTSPFGEFAEKAVAALESVKGTPLELHWKVDVQGFNAVTQVKAIEVQRGKLPRSTFVAPSGHAKAESPFSSRRRLDTPASGPAR